MIFNHCPICHLEMFINPKSAPSVECPKGHFQLYCFETSVVSFHFSHWITETIRYDLYSSEYKSDLYVDDFGAQIMQTSSFLDLGNTWADWDFPNIVNQLKTVVVFA